MNAVANSLQEHLADVLRVLSIDKDRHPDVFRSFDITHTPTFVLVRQGIELWRQVGLQDAATLAELIRTLLIS